MRQFVLVGRIAVYVVDTATIIVVVHQGNVVVVVILARTQRDLLELPLTLSYGDLRTTFG
jgi:hypothetical protein